MSSTPSLAQGLPVLYTNPFSVDTLRTLDCLPLAVESA